MAFKPYCEECNSWHRPNEEHKPKEGWTGRKCQPCKGTGENLSADYPRSCSHCGGTGDEWGVLTP